MNHQDIYIQFALELKKTQLLDQFDAETGLAVMKLPVTQREVCAAVENAVRWLLAQDSVLTPFLKAVRVHKEITDPPFRVHVRCRKPTEDDSGCTSVEASVKETAVTGDLEIVLYSHTVLDLFVIVDELLRLLNPAVVDSLIYDED